MAQTTVNFNQEELEFEPEGKTIINIYQYLMDKINSDGDGIDPKKIKFNPEEIEEIIQKDAEEQNIKKSKLMLMYLNQGPSSSRKVSKGKVLIEDGAFFDSETE